MDEMQLNGQMHIDDFLKRPKSADEYDKADLIYLFAQTGSGFCGGKERIYHIFKSGMSRHERAEAIKNEYGIGGVSSAQCFIKRIICGYTYDARGAFIRYRDKFGQLHEIAATWDEIAAAIEKAISRNEYLNADLN